LLKASLTWLCSTFIFVGGERSDGLIAQMRQQGVPVIMLSGSFEFPPPRSLVGATVLAKPVSEAELLTHLGPLAIRQELDEDDRSRLSGCPLPKAVSSAMMAKVGVAARHSQSAATRAADPRLSSNACFEPPDREVMKTSGMVILVVAAPPDARLIAPLRRTIEPRVHAPDAIHPRA